MKTLFFLFAILICSSGYTKNALVIILGQLRASEITYENIKANLIDNLNADLAICVGVNRTFNFNDPFYKFSKYKFLYPEYNDYAMPLDLCFHDLYKFSAYDSGCVNWREYQEINGNFLGGTSDLKKTDLIRGGSGGVLIFYRWMLLNQLIKHDILEKYDYFIITRSDFFYLIPHPSLDVFSPENLYFPDGEHYGGVTDRHVVLPRKFVKSYLNILESMMDAKKKYKNELLIHTDLNIESLIKFHLQKEECWEKSRFFPYIMFTVRNPSTSTRWSVGDYSESLGYFIKYRSEFDMAVKHKEDLEKEGVDCNIFYKTRIN